MITSLEIIKSYPELLEFLEKPKRRYEIQERFDLDRGEAALITDKLLADGYIENTSLGWKTAVRATGGGK